MELFAFLLKKSRVRICYQMVYHFRRVCRCIPCLFIFRQATGGLSGIWHRGRYWSCICRGEDRFAAGKNAFGRYALSKAYRQCLFLCDLYSCRACIPSDWAGAFQPLCRLIHCDGVMPNALRNWRLNVHSEPKPQSNATSAQAAPPFDRRAAALLMRTLDRYCCGVSPEKRLNERSSDEWLKKHISASCGTVKFSRKCALI